VDVDVDVEACTLAAVQPAVGGDEGQGVERNMRGWMVKGPAEERTATLAAHWTPAGCHTAPGVSRPWIGPIGGDEALSVCSAAC
jgi:hypothetical protein